MQRRDERARLALLALKAQESLPFLISLVVVPPIHVIRAVKVRAVTKNVSAVGSEAKS